MANTNLAQHEQYLKHLDQHFKEIGDLHKKMHDILSVLQTNVEEACHHINVSWSKVVNLLVVTEQLRQNRKELEQQK